MNRLAGKVAIVFGAGSIGPGWGNGKATAVIFAREGARVLAVDKNPQAAEETASIIHAEGFECFPLKSDVLSATQVEQAVETCVQRFGRIDILHNNVGFANIGGPVEMDESVWDLGIDLNLKSMFLTCK